MRVIGEGGAGGEGRGAKLEKVKVRVRLGLGLYDGAPQSSRSSLAWRHRELSTHVHMGGCAHVGIEGWSYAFGFGFGFGLGLWVRVRVAVRVQQAADDEQVRGQCRWGCSER